MMSQQNDNSARAETLEITAQPEPLFANIGRGDTLLYLAALAIILLGVWGIQLALDDVVIGVLVLCGASVGFVLSIWVRRTKEPLLTSLLLLAACLGFILLLRKLFGIYILFWIAPSILLMPEPTLAATAGMGLILVISCFFLFSRPALTFTVIPVLTIFGLLGSLLDIRVIIAFLLFLFISTFLLGYEHILSMKEEFGLQLSRADTRRLPSQQLRISGGFLLIVLALGLVLGGLYTAVFSRTSVQGLLDALEGLERIAPDASFQNRPSRPAGDFSRTGKMYRVGQGPTTLSERKVMYVRADTPAFWRQGAYDFYAENGWQVAPGETPAERSFRRGQVVLSDSTDIQGRHLLQQEFRLEYNFRQGLPAAAQPVEVDFGSDANFSSLMVDRFGCLVRADNILPAGTSYRVLSSVTNIAGPATGETLGRAERERYLQLPWEAREVETLVEEILTENLSPAAKVNALLSHIQSGQYRYTLQAQAVPAEEDAATYFLFKSKEGYCDLFATAFALMCRAAGIPSRLAVGFTEGEYDPSTGEYLVKESHGHAWVEVFLEGRGWVTVDPTPPAEITEATQQASGPAWWKNILRKMRFSPVVLFFCVLVCAGIMKVLWWDPWREQRRWEKRLWSSTKGKIIVIYARMCRLLARRGLLRQPWQTPLEYLETLSLPEAKLGDALQPAQQLTQIFISSRYAPETDGIHNVTAAQKALLQLKQNLRRNGGPRFPWQKQK